MMETTVIIEPHTSLPLMPYPWPKQCSKLKSTNKILGLTVKVVRCLMNIWMANQEKNKKEELHDMICMMSGPLPVDIVEEGKSANFK